MAKVVLEETHEKRKEIGERIHDMRLAAGLTRRKLAEIVECRQTEISFWELGQRALSYEMAEKIAKAIKSTAEELGYEKQEWVCPFPYHLL